MGGEGGDKNLTTNCSVASGKDSSLQKMSLLFSPVGFPLTVFTLTQESSFFVENNWVVIVYTTLPFLISHFGNCSYDDQKDKKYLRFPSFIPVRMKYCRAHTEEHS